VPEDHSNKFEHRRAEQSGPAPKTVAAPILPSRQETENAKSDGNSRVESDVKTLRDRLRSAEKWMIWLTGAIALFALCQVGAAFLQWRAMEDQLAEMKSGSTDTHNLATAAGSQAGSLQNLATSTATQSDRTKDLADRMKDQADRTKTIAEQAIIQAKAAKVSVDAAQISANIATSQLELTERPWVFFKDARVVSPLTFDSNGATVTFEIVLRNSGPSPAVDVWLLPRLYLLPKKQDAIPPVERLCDNKTPKGMSRHGLTLFSGTDSPPQRITVGLSKDEMAKAGAEHPAMQSGPIVVITPLVCVSYSATFKPDTRYSSGIQYLLWPTIWLDKMRPGSSIPIEELPLNRGEFFGEIAH
jgi:hypothetical protein